MAETRAQDYKAKLDALVDQALALPASARKAVLDQLRQAADSIRTDLARTDPSSYSAARLNAVKSEVERVMAQFARNASGEVAKAQRTMYEDTSRGTTAALQVATNQLAVLPVIDTKQLTIAQGYSADLITGLSRATSQQINSALQRGALGGSTLSQLIEQIGGALEGGTFSGLFSEAGARAASISTNEILRIHSLASFARIKDVSQRHAGIEKEWLHIMAARVPRVTHILASTQVRPVDEPFDVGGEKLMYPRDPSGSASNTINCHCLLRPKVSPALLQPSDRERGLLQQHGLRIVTTKN